MVGVVGSSPIAPTKQNPLCWAVWKGSPKGGPFFRGDAVLALLTSLTADNGNA
jgi:hypothetical protein